MITDGEKWHYLVVKKLSVLLRGITSNHNEDFYCLNCFRAYMPCRILIVGGSGSGKTNALLNLINNQLDINKIYLYAKDPYEAKYQYLINKREKVGLNHFDDHKAFIEYSNDMQDVYKNIEDYNPGKKRKVLIILMI